MLNVKVLIIFSLTFSALVISDDHVTPATAEEDHSEVHADHDDYGFLDFFGDDNTEDDGHLEHHLKEYLGLDKSVANMTDGEKDWYYFKLHDTDEDFQLDGLELLKAWQHHYLEHVGHEGMTHMDNSTEEAQKYIEAQNESFISMVDEILKEQDTNNDGYLDYFEYMTAKQLNRDEAQKHKGEEKNKENGAEKTK